MRVRFAHPVALRLLTLVLALSLLEPGVSSAAQAPVPDKAPVQAPVAETVLAILNDKPMPDGLWPALVVALREELASGSPEMRALLGETADQAIGGIAKHSAGADAASQIQIVRGDSIGPYGDSSRKFIWVRLHGECKIVPQPGPVYFAPTLVASGTLGWVISDHGHIGDYAHVDCNRIGEMLAPHALGYNRDERNRMMAVAIARVILHEWMHIATQSSHHSEHGLTKAHFGVADLLQQPAKPPVKRSKLLLD